MKIKLIDFGAGKLPERAHFNDSGAEVYALSDVIIAPHSVAKVPTGWGANIPDGYDIVVHCKSGLASRGIIAANAPVDAGYTGEINAILLNTGPDPVEIKAGEKVGQLVLRPVVYADFVMDLGAERGAGAFGSTGR